MDTRTGLIYEGTRDEIAAQVLTADPLGRSLDQIKQDMVPVKNVGDSRCPKCHGTGAIPRGLNSKRFKPCPCTL